MRDQIIVRSQKEISLSFGEYEIQFVKPAAAEVELVSYTFAPARVVYLATRAYKGIYDVDIQYDGTYTLKSAFEDIQKTKLQTPLEIIHTLWLLKDVTRAFTHQLVRYRVGTAFIQESMRFLGMKKIFKVLVTHQAASDQPYTVIPDGFHRIEEPNLDLYCHGAVGAIRSYVDLLDRGVPSEDARGVLPTNIMTRLYFDCSLRTLQAIFPQRLCCQAQQGEWQPILIEMRKQMKEKMGNEIESLLRAPYEHGQDCGYRASFDRPCIWQKGE